MDEQTRRDVRFLKVYAVLSTAVLAVFCFAAFQKASQKQHFGEIDVERLNIVEKDGTPRLILSNKARFPGLIIKGKEYPHERNTGGILYFNDEGTENGGLTTDVQKTPDGYEAGGILTFDQYNQDQTVAMLYRDRNGKRTAGLQVWDRGETPILELYDRVQAVRRMPEGPEKQKAMQELAKLGGAGRLFVGKIPNEHAVVALSDAQGRTRLRLVVEPAGAARIEFLDEAGKVTSTVPGSSGAGGR